VTGGWWGREVVGFAIWRVREGVSEGGERVGVEEIEE